jgi:hypothetical protein
MSPVYRAPTLEQTAAEPDGSASPAGHLSLEVSGIIEVSYRRYVATLYSDELGGRGPGATGER